MNHIFGSPSYRLTPRSVSYTHLLSPWISSMMTSGSKGQSDTCAYRAKSSRTPESVPSSVPLSAAAARPTSLGCSWSARENARCKSGECESSHKWPELRRSSNSFRSGTVSYTHLTKCWRVVGFWPEWARHWTGPLSTRLPYRIFRT